MEKWNNYCKTVLTESRNEMESKRRQRKTSKQLSRHHSGRSEDTVDKTDEPAVQGVVV